MKKYIAVILTIIATSTFAVATHAQINPLALTQTLSVGSTGTEVSWLQQFLKDKGLFNYPTITGRFGLITKGGVALFQTNNNLFSDGVVGPITRAKIAEILATGNQVVQLNHFPVNHYVNNVTRRDTTTPTIVITSHTNGDTVSGMTTFTADAADTKGVVGVQFQIDGVDVGSEDTVAPYSVSWDSTSAADATYTLTAIARDATGNTTTSIPITFTTNNYPQLTISRSGTGVGAVTSSPAGINCGGTCIQAFPLSTVVTLTPASAVGSTFTGWSGGGCSGTGVCTVTMNAATSVTATFARIPYALTTAKGGSGNGIVTSTPAGVNCGATCSALFDYGTVVTLTATADGSSTFAGWSGGGCSGTGTCAVTVTAATMVTAIFDSI